MAKFPCQGCPDRHIGCHSECEKYKAAQEAQRIQHDAEAKVKQVDRDFQEMYIQSCIQHKKRPKF